MTEALPPDPVLCHDDEHYGCYNTFPRKQGCLCMFCKRVKELGLEPESAPWLNLRAIPQCKSCGVISRGFAPGALCGVCLGTNGVAVANGQALISDLAQQTQARLRKSTASVQRPMLAGATPIASGNMSNELLLAQAKKPATRTQPSDKIHITWTLDINKSDKLSPPTRNTSIELYPKDTFLNEAIQMAINDTQIFSDFEKMNHFRPNLNEVAITFSLNKATPRGPTCVTLDTFYQRHLKASQLLVEAGLKPYVHLAGLDTSAGRIKKKCATTPCLQLTLTIRRCAETKPATAVNGTTTNMRTSLKRSRTISNGVSDLALKRLRPGNIFEEGFVATSALEATCNILNLELAQWKKTDDDITAGEWDWSRVLEGVAVDTKEFCSGSTKKCFKVCDKGTNYVIKAFYNFGNWMDDTISTSTRNHAALLKEHTRSLLLGDWLRNFYNDCDTVGVNVFEGFDVAPMLLVRESQAFNMIESDVSKLLRIEDDPYYLLEERRSSVAQRYCGSLQFPGHNSLKGQTITALCHWVYKHTQANVVLADVEGTEIACPDGSTQEILFDTITHSHTEDSGVGDLGTTGIQAFCQSHICNDICHVLNLGSVPMTGSCDNPSLRRSARNAAKAKQVVDLTKKGGDKSRPIFASSGRRASMITIPPLAAMHSRYQYERPEALPEREFVIGVLQLHRQMYLEEPQQFNELDIGSLPVNAACPYRYFQIPIGVDWKAVVESQPFRFIGKGRLASIAHNSDATSRELGAQDGLKGSKKKVFQAAIICDEALEGGLGSADVTAIVAAKVYFDLFFTETGDSAPRIRTIKRPELLKECTLEANTMRIASALMDLGYDAIKRAQASNKSSPPYPIPSLPRIAHAGIAINTVDLTSGPIYLLEEYIEKFRKFLPTQLSEPPLDLKTEDDQILAELFCAIQHVQFIETHGLAFVSDFQGNEAVLSDLKVLVDPSLKRMFTSSFAVDQSTFFFFPRRHRCNSWCTWLGLPPVPPFTPVVPFE